MQTGRQTGYVIGRTENAGILTNVKLSSNDEWTYISTFTRPVSYYIIEWRWYQAVDEEQA